jgi:NitT/TauT family transport system substrate-binding protein
VVANWNKPPLPLLEKEGSWMLINKLIMKKHIIEIAVLVTALAVCACLCACDRADKTLEKITIAYSTTPDAGLAEVAQMQGYYRQEGLDAVPQKYALGKDALQAVLEGKADFATVAETPVMFAVMQGEKISVIATIQMSKKNYAIVARSDKGILAPHDLNGKKIAVRLGTSGEFFLDSFLTMHAISRKDVNVVDLSPNGLRDALVNGDVDAISALPFVTVQVQKKLADKAITFEDEDIFTQFFTVVATREFIRKNPEKVRRILLAFIKSEEFMSRNPEKAQKIVADFTGLDRTLLAEIWGVNYFNVALDQTLVLALEDLSQWAIKNRLTKAVKVPNYLDYIYFDGLKSVKPEAVRILR